MGIIEQAKDIANLIKKYNDQELYQKICDLRDEIFDLREENVSLRQQLSDINKNRDLREKLIRDGNCYYMTEDAGRVHPYCMVCFDYDEKLVSLILDTCDWGTTITCNICRARGR